MLPADGGYQKMGGGNQQMGGGYQQMGGGYGPGMAGGNDMHGTVGVGIGVGRDYVVAEQQEGPSTVTETYTKEPMNKTPLYVGLGVVGLLIVVYFVMAGQVSDVHITATDHRWRFEVHTEMFQQHITGDWQRNIPYDSYNRMCQPRMHNQVHSRVIARPCHTEHTTHNERTCTTTGGVEHCQTVSTPVVANVCHNVYEYYRVYDTWCDYSVNRWVRAPMSPAVSSGHGLEPYWPYAPISNCGNFGCTRLSHTEQHYIVDFHIDDGHSSGHTDECDFPAPEMWGWITDNVQYQAQATNFGSSLVCNSIQTTDAAPPPPDFHFQPSGGNSTDVLPVFPADMTTAAPGDEYAHGGEFTGTLPPNSPSPPPAFLAAEEPEITELDVAELAEGQVTE